MIIGHRKQIENLKNILRSENIPQSYIFSGPESVGKMYIAQKFAKALIAGNDNFSDGESQRVTIDLEVLQPEVIEKKGVLKIKEIEVKKVREAQKRLSLFPTEGKFRVLIIDDAQKLNVASQNSLLKTLEEPNKTSIIILITNEDDKILNTIKSRCRKIDFALVGLKEIKDAFSDKQNIPDDAYLEKVSIYSMGRPGRAKKLLEDKKFFEENEKATLSLRKIGAMSVAEKFALAEKMSKNPAKASEEMKLWVWFLRIHAYKNLKEKKRLTVYYKLTDKIENVLKKMNNTSLNSRLLLENLFLEL